MVVQVPFDLPPEIMETIKLNAMRSDLEKQISEYRYELREAQRASLMYRLFRKRDNRIQAYERAIDSLERQLEAVNQKIQSRQ